MGRRRRRRWSVVAKIELGKVTVQMFGRDVVVCADNPALEDRKVAFGRVRMPKVRADIFFDGVIHSAVSGKFFSDGVINWRIASHDVRRSVNFGIHYLAKRPPGQVPF